MSSALLPKPHRGRSESGSVLEWFHHAPEHAHVAKDFRTAGTSGVKIFRVSAQPAALYKRPSGEEFTPQIILKPGGPIGCDHGARFHSEPVSFGTLCFPPPQTHVSHDCSSPLDFITLAIPRAAVSAALSRENGQAWTSDFGALHTRLFRDAAISELMMRIWRETASDTPGSAMLVESLWHSIVHLLMAASAQAWATQKVRYQHGDWRLRRAIEYIQARLTDDVGLAEVAAAVDLSPSRFAALFRAGTGEPPHRWLLQRRLERARDLLVDPKKSVTEIALDCGFASSQHLAAAFQKNYGLTPTQYRHERLS